MQLKKKGEMVNKHVSTEMDTQQSFQDLLWSF